MINTNETLQPAMGLKCGEWGGAAVARWGKERKLNGCNAIYVSISFIDLSPSPHLYLHPHS